MADGSAGKEEMVALFKDMRLKEARQYLIPHVNKMRNETGSALASKQPPKLRDLQQLAVHWKLNKRPNFWTEFSEEEDLLQFMHKYAMKLDKEEAKRAKRGGAGSDSKAGARRVSTMPRVDLDEEEDEEEDWREKLARLKDGKREYTGDLFGTRGNYDGGLIYASRRPPGAPASPLEAQRFGNRAASIPKSSESSSGGAPGNSGGGAGAGGAGGADDSESKAANTMEQLKVESTTTLRDLSKNEAMREGLANTPAVQSCYDMWKATPNRDVKRNCAMTLTNLYTTLPMERDEFLAPVLELAAGETDIGIVGTCARALLNRYLSDRPVHTSNIANVISAARSMERYCDAATRMHIAHLLRVMLSNSTDEPGKGGELAPVTQEAADRACETAVHEGVLPILVSLSGMPLDENRHEHCAVAFYRLSQLQSVHGELSGRSVLPTMVALLSHLTPAISDNAALALYELTCSPDAAVSDRLVRNKTVARALMGTAVDQAKILESGSRGDEFKLSDTFPMGRKATAALLRLSGDPELLPVMVEDGVAKALFSWFNNGDDAIKHNAVVALCNIYTCKAGQDELVDLGFARVIIEAADIKIKPVATSDSAEAEALAAAEAEKADIGVRRRCSHALYLLSQGSEELATHLIERGAIDALVSLAGTKDYDTLLNSVRSLQHLAEKASAHEPMTEHGAVATFAKFAKSKDMEVLRSCTLGLCHLSNSPVSHKELLSQDCIAVLVRLVAATGIKSPCVRAFCQLSAYREAHEKLIEQGVLPLFIAQSRLTKSDIRRDCAQALYNMSCVKKREAVMLAEGVPAALTIVALFRADDPETKDLCAAALFNLMYDPAGRQSLVDDGVLWAFIKLALATGDTGDAPESGGAAAGTALMSSLRSSPAKSPAKEGGDGKEFDPTDPDVSDTRQTCTRLIRNLACDKSLVRQTAEKRTLSALAKFSRVPDPQTRVNCAVALTEMARHRSLHRGLIERGALTILRRLAKDDDVIISHRCAVALFRLSHAEELRPALAGNRNLPFVISSLVDTLRAEVAEYGGGAICVSSTEKATSGSPIPVDSKEAHHAHALHVLRILSTITCNLTATEEERVNLASNGIVDAVLRLEGFSNDDASIITNERKQRAKKEREARTRTAPAGDNPDGTPRALTPGDSARSLSFGAAWLAKSASHKPMDEFRMPPMSTRLADKRSFELVTTTLFNLTAEPEVCRLLDASQDEGVPEAARSAVLFLLRSIAHDTVDREGEGKLAGSGVTGLVLSALANLSKWPTLSMLLYSDATLCDLIEIAEKREMPFVQAGVANCIANLVAHNAVRPMEPETMAKIVSLAASSGRQGQFPITTDAYVFTFWVLSRFPKSTVALVNAGFLTALVTITKRLDAPLRTKEQPGDALFADQRRTALHWELAQIVRAVCEFEEHRDALLEVPVVASICKYGRSSKLGTRRDVFNVLLALVKKHAQRKKLVEAGDAVPLLIERANNTKEDMDVRELCARALRKLSGDEELSKASSLDAGGLVQSVLGVLSKSDIEAAEKADAAEEAGEAADDGGADEGKDEGEDGEASGGAGADLLDIQVPDNEVRVPGGAVRIFPSASLHGDEGFDKEHGPSKLKVVTAEPEETFNESRTLFEGDTTEDSTPDWEKITDHEGLPKPAPVAPTAEGEEAKGEEDAERGAGGGGGDARTDSPDGPASTAKPALADTGDWQRSPRASGSQVLPPMSSSPSPVTHAQQAAFASPAVRTPGKRKASLDPIDKFQSPASSITRAKLAKREEKARRGARTPGSASRGGFGASASAGLGATHGSRNTTSAPSLPGRSPARAPGSRKKRKPAKGPKGAKGRSVVMEHVESTYGIKGGAM